MRLFSHPILCNYYLTYRCNARCSFCDIWQKPSVYADKDAFIQNLVALKKIGVKVIDFTGGEPLLHQDAAFFLEKARENKFITTLTTNCLLYPKRAEELKGLVSMLHFSLDSAEPEKHNAIRDVPAFEFVMQSIELALSLDEKPDILFTVTDDNMNDIEALYNRLILPNNLILILNPAFNYANITTQLSANSFPSLRRWANKPNIYLNKAFLSLRENGGNSITNPVCKAASSTIVISPDNTLILPCYHLGKRALPIQNNLLELWRSDAVQKLIAMEGKYPECEGCAINCYMQPSFMMQTNNYFWQALPSTLKYTLEKWVYG